jgi:hypothetical protein
MKYQNSGASVGCYSEGDSTWLRRSRSWTHEGEALGSVNQHYPILLFDIQSISRLDWLLERSWMPCFLVVTSRSRDGDCCVGSFLHPRAAIRSSTSIFRIFHDDNILICCRYLAVTAEIIHNGAATQKGQECEQAQAQ